MRILGRLAVAAGATAVILLVSPSANAAAESSLNDVSKSSVQNDKNIGALTGLLNKLLSGVANGGNVGGGLAGVSGLGG